MFAVLVGSDGGGGGGCAGDGDGARATALTVKVKSCYSSKELFACFACLQPRKQIRGVRPYRAFPVNRGAHTERSAQAVETRDCAGPHILGS